MTNIIILSDKRKKKKGVLPVLSVRLSEGKRVLTSCELHADKQLLTNAMLEIVKELLQYDEPETVADIQRVLEKYRDEQ